MKLSEAVELFLKYQHDRKSRAKSTISTYRSMLSFFIKFCGDMHIEDMTLRDIDNYAESLELKPKASKNRLTAVRSLVKFLYSKDYISIKPEAVDIPQVKDTEANFLDYDEQRALVSACCSDKELAIVLLLLRSGLRISELADLQIDDIFEHSAVVRKGKNNKPRLTFITREVDLVLKKHLSGRMHGHCFVNKHG